MPQLPHSSLPGKLSLPQWGQIIALVPGADQTPMPTRCGQELESLKVTPALANASG
jgi:hypothetical protein